MNGSLPDRAEQFGQRGEVGAVAADAEHAFARLAVERLDHDLAMPRMESPDFRRGSG